MQAGLLQWPTDVAARREVPSGQILRARREERDSLRPGLLGALEMRSVGVLSGHSSDTVAHSGTDSPPAAVGL